MYRARAEQKDNNFISNVHLSSSIILTTFHILLTPFSHTTTCFDSFGEQIQIDFFHSLYLQNQKVYVAVVKCGAYVLLMVFNIAIISIIVKSCLYCFNRILCSQFHHISILPPETELNRFHFRFKNLHKNG